jgi:hypothetical protein
VRNKFVALIGKDVYYSTEKYLDGNLNFAKDVNIISIKGVFMKLCLMIFAPHFGSFHI